MRPKQKTEADFPRGGKEKLDEASLKQVKRAGKDLFQATDDAEQKRKKKAAKRKATKDKNDPVKKKKTEAREEFWMPNAGFVKVLTHKDLVEGSLVMGCIKNVMDYELKVQFPNNLSGVVPITGLCSAYQELLEMAAEGDASRMEELVTLQDLFHPGQFVVCMVERARDVLEGESKATPAKLTMDPRQVNREMSASGLKSGMTLHGFVSSCEDHGYIIDIGVSKVKAFLPKKDACSHLKDEESLHIGSYLRCLVTNVNEEAMTSGDVRMVTIDIDPEKTSKASIRPDMGINLRTLLPGMSMNVTVDKVTDNGLVAKFLDEFQGSVHEKHLTTKPSAYSEKQEFRARVLYLQPVTKVVVFTQLKHFVDMDAVVSCQQFAQLRIGTDIADAEVTKLNKWGAYFSFGNNVQGFARKALLTDEKKTPVEKNFTVASKHLCRVIGFNYVDNMVLLTAKETDVTKPYFHLEDLNPGDKVVAVVAKHLSNDVVQVKVGVTLRGFIHRLHNADVPIGHVDKKFPVGSTVECRILGIEYEKKALLLTCKGRQLKPALPLVTSFEQCSKGNILEGCIVDIKEKGCVVVFFNGVKGFAPAVHLNLDEGTLMTDVFFLGQMIRCRVIRAKDNVNGMLVSFKVDADEMDEKKMTSKKLPTKQLTGKVECKIVDCRVTAVGEESLEVELASPKATLSLAHEQLTDHLNLSRPLLRSYHAGDQMKALCWKDDQGVHITAKPSLMHSIEKAEYPKTYADVQDGNILNGFVRALQEDRILVKLFNGLTVGVHKSFASDEPVSRLPDLLALGQTLSVCFRDNVLKNGNLARSLRFSHLYKEDRPSGDNILESFLADYERVMAAMKKSKDDYEKKLASYRIGQAINVTVDESRDFGVTCFTSDGVKGFATLQCINEHDEDAKKISAGESIRAVVLYVDPGTKCLELSLKKSTIDAISKHLDKSPDVLVKQVIRAEVLLIKDDFVLVLLHEHALGRVAFMPAMRNFNDFLEKNLYTIGQVNKALIKRVTPNGILANLQIHQEKLLQSKPSLLTLGKKLQASITGFKAHQINIKIGKVEGRIHLTNVVDSAQDGTMLRRPYSEKQQLMVREISNQKAADGTKEYTVKPSLLSTDDTSASIVRSVNDKVIGVVNKISKNGLQVVVDPNTKIRVSLAHSKRSHTDFKSGAAYNFIVKSIFEGQLQLSLDDSSIAKAKYDKGQKVEGVVKCIEKKYIRIKLPQKTWGFIELREETPPGVRCLKEDQVVKCGVLSRRLQGKRTKTTWNVEVLALQRSEGEWMTLEEAEKSKENDEEEDEEVKQNGNGDVSRKAHKRKITAHKAPAKRRKSSK